MLFLSPSVKIMERNGNFCGLILKGGEAPEHQQGILSLLEDFGVNEEGINSKRPETFTIFTIKKDGIYLFADWWRYTTSNELNYRAKSFNLPTYKRGYTACWDSGAFTIKCAEHNDKEFFHLRELYDAAFQYNLQLTYEGNSLGIYIHERYRS